MGTVEQDVICEVVRLDRKNRRQENPDGFRFYRSAMLETYSDKTLECYYEYMRSKLEEGENLLKWRLKKMVQGAAMSR